MTERVWYYSQNGQTFGPVWETDLRKLLASNSLPQDVMVWSEGFTSTWVAAHSVLPQATPAPALAPHVTPPSEPSLAVALAPTQESEPQSNPMHRLEEQTSAQPGGSKWEGLDSIATSGPGGQQMSAPSGSRSDRSGGVSPAQGSQGESVSTPGSNPASKWEGLDSIGTSGGSRTDGTQGAGPDQGSQEQSISATGSNRVGKWEGLDSIGSPGGSRGDGAPEASPAQGSQEQSISATGSNRGGKWEGLDSIGSPGGSRSDGSSGGLGNGGSPGGSVSGGTPGGSRSDRRSTSSAEPNPSSDSSNSSSASQGGNQWAGLDDIQQAFAGADDPRAQTDRSRDRASKSDDAGNLESEMRKRSAKVSDSVPWWKAILFGAAAQAAAKAPGAAEAVKENPKKYIRIAVIAIFAMFFFQSCVSPWLMITGNLNALRNYAGTTSTTAASRTSNPQLEFRITSQEGLVFNIPTQEKKEGDVLTYTYAPNVVYSTIGGATLAFIVAFVLMFKIRFLMVPGVLIVLASGIALALFAPELLMNKVIVDPKHFVIHEGRWWSPLVYDVPYSELDYVEQGRQGKRILTREMEKTYKREVVQDMGSMKLVKVTPTREEVQRIKSVDEHDYMFFKRRLKDDQESVIQSGCLTFAAINKIIEKFQSAYTVRQAFFKINGISSKNDIKRLGKELTEMPGVHKQEILRVGSNLSEVIYDSKLTDIQTIVAVLKKKEKKENLEISEVADGIYFAAKSDEENKRGHYSWSDNGPLTIWGISRSTSDGKDEFYAHKPKVIFVGDSSQTGFTSIKNAKYVLALSEKIPEITFVPIDASTSNGDTEKRFELQIDRAKLPCLILLDKDNNKRWMSYGQIDPVVVKEQLENIFKPKEEIEKPEQKEPIEQQRLNNSLAPLD